MAAQIAAWEQVTMPAAVATALVLLVVTDISFQHPPAGCH